VLARELTARHGALLIFDEVMTDSAWHTAGPPERFRITPDLTTLGKVIGGGLPVGAYGGRRELLELVVWRVLRTRPARFSGNPLAMTAGIIQLQHCAKPDRISG
jgi:glutamate-1-semialdehyde 2,1-aminomutase